jgi:outer membrane protein OmpA-like peptidoglycan-associated protein
MKFNIMKTGLASLLFFLILSGAAFGQTPKFTLSGKVTTADSGFVLEGIPIKLTCSDGSSVVVMTNNEGIYTLDSTRIKPERSYVFWPASNEGKYYDKHSREGYYPGMRTKLLTKGVVESTNFHQDFASNKVTGCGGIFPYITFEKNSPVVSGSMKDSLKILKAIFIDNPNLVIQLNGHCSSDETNPNELSHQRALNAKAFLMEQGIEAERILAQGFGIKKLLFSDAELKKAQTREARGTINQRNRRVVFQVIRINYVSHERKEINKEEVKAVQVRSVVCPVDSGVLGVFQPKPFLISDPTSGIFISKKTKSQTNVKSIMDGQVFGITRFIDSTFIVVIERGNLKIAYSNLHSTPLKKSDKVKTGDILGVLSPNEDGVELHINFFSRNHGLDYSESAKMVCCPSCK